MSNLVRKSIGRVNGHIKTILTIIHNPYAILEMALKIGEHLSFGPKFRVEFSDLSTKKYWVRPMCCAAIKTFPHFNGVKQPTRLDAVRMRVRIKSDKTCRSAYRWRHFWDAWWVASPFGPSEHVESDELHRNLSPHLQLLRQGRVHLGHLVRGNHETLDRLPESLVV